MSDRALGWMSVSLLIVAASVSLLLVPIAVVAILFFLAQLVA